MSDEKQHPVVLRVDPVRERNLDGIEKHANRTSKIPAPNVDPSRTHLNRVLFGSSEIVKDALGMAAMYPPAHSNSSILWAEMVLTANADWFDKLAPNWRSGDLGEKGEAWLAANLDWLKKKYPGLINVTLHLDEGAPHLHVLLSPVVTYEQGYRRGSHEVTKINYRRIFSDDIRMITAARKNNKSSDWTKLGKLQTEYSEAMKPFGLIRGRRNSKGKHITPAEHRKRINAELPTSPPPPFTSPEPRSVGPFGKSAVEEWAKEKKASETQRDEYFGALESKAREVEFMKAEIESLKYELREKDAELNLAKAEIDKLRAIPLEAIADRLEPETGPISLTDDAGKPRWKGAIDMLKDVVGFNYREAVAWLFYEFGAQAALIESLQEIEPKFKTMIQDIRKGKTSHPKATLGEELQRFKGEINLVEYASTAGYEIDRKESSKHSVVMRRELDGDKIVVATSGSGHGVYFSVRDNQDHGTIIDFIQKRTGSTLGQVRQDLRPWIGIGGTPPPISEPVFSKPLPTSRDRQAVLLKWQQARALEDYSYLNSRGLTRADLAAVGVDDITKTDERGNVLFGHYDQDGLCGFEMKNKRFTGFAKGGEKGLWVAGAEDPKRIVVGESAISTLSYAKLFPDPNAAYLSFGGSWNETQPALLKAFFNRFPWAEIVIAAVDNDLGGDEFTAALDELAPGRVERHSPTARGDDWNDVLKGRLRLRVPAPQAAPAQKARAVVGPGQSPS